MCLAEGTRSTDSEDIALAGTDSRDVTIDVTLPRSLVENATGRGSGGGLTRYS